MNRNLASTIENGAALSTRVFFYKEIDMLIILVAERMFRLATAFKVCPPSLRSHVRLRRRRAQRERGAGVTRTIRNSTGGAS